MKIVFFTLFILLISCSSKNPPQNTFEETRKTLTESRISEENFNKLFQKDDEIIEDLIIALNDQDKNVRNNAQTMIRYIGNPKATKAMYQWLSENALKEKDDFPTNPIPIPIDDWEYKFEEKSYMYSSRSNLKNSYTLFFDDSEKAKLTLQKFIDEENNKSYDFLGNGKKLARLRELNLERTFQDNGDLANAVLQIPFFQYRTDDLNNKTDLEKLKSNIITFNEKKTRALVNVQNEDGRLEVVVEKVKDSWKFYSIIRVSVY